MLLAAVEHDASDGGDPRTFFGKLYGQERNLTTASVAHEPTPARYRRFRHRTRRHAAQPLCRPQHRRAATFDCVIANPPFSLKQWGAGVGKATLWSCLCRLAHRQQWRLRLGAAHDQLDGAAYRAHGRRLTTGRCFAVGRRQIRRKLLEMDLVEAVIGSPNLFYRNRDWRRASWCCVGASNPTARAKVLIVDASELYRKERAQNMLSTLITPPPFSTGCRRLRMSRSCTGRIGEVPKIGRSTSPAHYCRNWEDVPPLDGAIADFKALAVCTEAETNLRQIMHEVGSCMVSLDQKNWKATSGVQRRSCAG